VAPIWNGFVAFGNMGFLGEDLANLVTQTSLRDQMIQMIERKADYGRRNHQQYTIGATRIDEWFANPPGFLDALEERAWITPGNWANSRMHALMSFETGPMFRVFTDDEIALWAAYTESLAAPPRPPPPPVSAAHAMAALIDQLRPVQRGIPGHQTSMLADAQGMVHKVADGSTRLAGKRCGRARPTREQSFLHAIDRAHRPDGLRLRPARKSAQYRPLPGCGASLDLQWMSTARGRDQ
jgi:hypothetical protein